MGLPGEEGTPSQQPEGGPLSVLGDVIFAGAVLVMMYPCMRRTLKRIDRQFCRQFWRVSKVILVLATLSFVLMLMIAQQTRVTYCSLVRPYVGDHPDDEILTGILLRILVCGLLLFNFVCARRLHHVVDAFFRGNFGSYDCYLPDSVRDIFRLVSRRMRVQIPDDARFPDNSNTNSPVPMPPTPTYSDIFSTISSHVLHSESFQDRSPRIDSPPRLYCDVGTMVRFPEYQRSLCTLQFCQDHVNQVVRSPDRKSPLPSPLSSSHVILSPTASSTGFCAVSKSTFSNPYRYAGVHSSSSHHCLDSGRIPVSLKDFTGSDHGGDCEVQPVTTRDFSGQTSGGGGAGGQKGNVVITANCAQRRSGTGSAMVAAASPTCSYREGKSVGSASGSTAATFRLPHHAGVLKVRRQSHQLPTMLKMTRSGKIYGYG